MAQSTNNFTTTANPNQQEAITTTEGPLLIIAGPGSGKTFTLVERIVYLITQKNVAPESLLVVTFTDKAAQELTTRISNRLNEIGVRFNLNEMYLGTFHSICLRWLQDYREFTRLKRNFMMMDQFDQQYFFYQRIRAYEEIEGLELVVGSSKSAWSRSQTLLKWLNTVSEETLDAAELCRAADEPVRVLGECYTLYQQQLEEANALDFSTIQYEALKLLRGNPDILEELRKKLSYLMVDEYQDTNTIQEMLLTLLAGDDSPNLCVVGDDDQGLYRFRGATIRNILQFKDKFPANGCRQVRLTTNYRSHPDIIGFYNRWVKDQDWEDGGQTFRFEKTITPRTDKVFPDMPTTVRLSGATRPAYHQQVLDFLRTLRSEGHLTDWNQVAFLFKSVKNERAVALARFLEKNGIDVYSPRSNQFFEREEIRLMIGALIFLFPQFPEARKWNADAHLSIWEYYDNDCFELFAEHLRQPENADLLKWCKQFRKQHYPLTKNADYAFSGLFFRLLRFPLFSRYLDEDLLRQGLINSRAMRNLALFSQMLNKFEYLHNISVLTPDYLEKNLRDLFNQFLRYLMDGGLDEYEDEAEYAPSGCVSFLTIHQSKGLEFPVVIVDSLYATPRKQFTALDEILEQGYLSRPPFEPLAKTKFYDFRRLYYTAFSRAQNLLVLACQEKTGWGRTPSKYFADYFTDLPDWRDPAFKPADLPLAQVKEVNLKREYSFTSHLIVFENCAEQYRFFKELEFAPVRISPILFGTLVHQTIEDIHKTVLRGDESRLSEAQVQAWFDTNYVYLTKRERVYLDFRVKQLALGHVLRYYQRHQADWSHIRDCEVDVSLVKDEYILAGTIDLIAGQEGTVELVDFKSEKKLDVNDPKDREKLDRYRRQLEVYAHIVEERTGQAVSKTHLYYTSEDAGNPYITFPKDTRSIERTIGTFDQVVGRIEHKDFAIPERPAKLCKECDMRHYCDAKNWKFRS
jgi:DNA helicase-2/ATP-dependent DNA helicase PcrA